MLKKIAYALIGTLVTLFVLAGCSSASSSSATPTSVYGTWTTDEGDFVARIAKNSIVMNIVGGDVTSLYWKGTFTTSSDIKDGDRVLSRADAAALDASLLGEQDRTKVFTYEDGILSFEFSIMGSTRIVHLVRQ